MYRKTIAALIVLAACASSSVTFAQASCPTGDANRLSFIDMANSSNIITPTQLASAAHRIEMGSIPYYYTYITVAIITNLSTGYCSVYYLSYSNGSEPVTWLTKNSNLCLGPHSDFVDNAEEHGQAMCNGAVVDLQPMIYNGKRLRIYLGNGDDHAAASFGTDSLYGGAGSDELSDYGGTSDIAYGETNSDELQCSSGSSGLCDGGGAGDDIYDLVGTNDEVYGGGSTDYIYVCGYKEVDCGESAAGYSDTDRLYYQSTQSDQVNCEVIVDHQDPSCPW